MNDRSISLSSKIRLTRSIVTPIFLYACESWTLTAELQRRIQAMEMRCYHKILRISYKDHVTNEEVVPRSIRQLDHLLTTLNVCKLQQYSDVFRSSGLVKTILQGTMKGERRQGRREVVGRQHKGMERPGVRQAPDDSGEQGQMEETGCEINSGAPTTLAVKG